MSNRDRLLLNSQPTDFTTIEAAKASILAAKQKPSDPAEEIADGGSAAKQTSDAPAMDSEEHEIHAAQSLEEGSQSIADDAQDQMAEKDPNQVTIIGWVDLKAELTQKNKSVVLVREILEDNEHGGEGHDPSSCPFCKRRMNAAPKAAVVFVGENGKALGYPADRLLPLEHGDVVVIAGTADADNDIDLKITANGIFLKQ